MAIVPFSAKLNIQPGTTSDEPASVSVEVAPGRLVKARIYVPPGPRGEIELWLNMALHQIAPVEPGTYRNVDDDILDIPLDLEVSKNESRITLYGIAPYANFEHNIDLELLVDTASSPATPPAAFSLSDRLANLFGG